MNSNYSMPMNLGNPDEYTIEQFATKIKDLIGKVGLTKDYLKYVSQRETIISKTSIDFSLLEMSYWDNTNRYEFSSETID